MSKFTGPKVKLSRRLGIALTPKAARIMERRPGLPGQHGQQRRRGGSDYKKQLTEKQRLRAQYNLTERQLRNYFRKAVRARGNTGEVLIQILETRLDAVVLRGGLAKTIYAARQYVAHGHIQVNGKKVDIASFRVRPGDIVSVKERSRLMPCFEDAMVYYFSRGYVELDRANFSATFKRIPSRAEVPVICEESQVIEYYSK